MFNIVSKAFDAYTGSPRQTRSLAALKKQINSHIQHLDNLVNNFLLNCYVSSIFCQQTSATCSCEICNPLLTSPPTVHCQLFCSMIGVEVCITLFEEEEEEEEEAHQSSALLVSDCRTVSRVSVQEIMS